MSRMIAALWAVTVAIFISIDPSMAAVTTAAIDCNADAADWHDAGAGPIIAVQAPGTCALAIADSKPSNPGVGFHATMYGAVPWAYSGASHLWLSGSGFAIIAK